MCATTFCVVLDVCLSKWSGVAAVCVIVARLFSPWSCLSRLKGDAGSPGANSLQAVSKLAVEDHRLDNDSHLFKAMGTWSDDTLRVDSVFVIWRKEKVEVGSAVQRRTSILATGLSDGYIVSVSLQLRHDNIMQTSCKHQALRDQNSSTTMLRRAEISVLPGALQYIQVDRGSRLTLGGP